MAKSTKTTATKSTTVAKRAPRSSKKKADETLSIAMMGAATAVDSHDEALASLLAELDLPEELLAAAPEDAIVEPMLLEGPIEPTIEALSADVTAAEPDLEDIAAAVAAVAVVESYAETPAPMPTSAADTPSTDAPAAIETTIEAAAPKKPAKPRMHFANKVERIKFRLGDEFGDYMLLEIDDAMLEGEDLAAKQQETVGIIEKMSVKEKNRASLLFDFASGKSAKLNEVMRRALDVLATDAKLQTGDKGNLHMNLLTKPYSPAAARAMGRNTINMFAKLKVIQMTAKGEYVANPESLLMEAINGRGIAVSAAEPEAAPAPAPVAEPIAEVVAAPAEEVAAEAHTEALLEEESLIAPEETVEEVVGELVEEVIED